MIGDARAGSKSNLPARPLQFAALSPFHFWEWSSCGERARPGAAGDALVVGLCDADDQNNVNVL